MVDLGARHLAFMSRSGPSGVEASNLITELSSRGVHTEIICGSVTDRESVVEAVKKISVHRPLKGIVHAAMVEGVRIHSHQLLTPQFISLLPL